MLWTHAFSYCNTFRHLSAMAYLLDTSVIRMQRRWMLTEWRERIGPDYQREKEEDYFWRKRGLPRREEMKQLKDCLINLVCHLTVTDIFFHNYFSMDKFVYYLYHICFRNWTFCERRGYRKNSRSCAKALLFLLFKFEKLFSIQYCYFRSGNHWPE